MPNLDKKCDIKHVQRRHTEYNMDMSLREQVDHLLPGWESWYPSLFDAAVDLGVIRAQVCSPDDLYLSRRHSSVQSAAATAHRDQWGGDFDNTERQAAGNNNKKRRKRRRNANSDA